MPTYTASACLLLLAAEAYAQDRTMNLQKVEYLVGELSEHPQELTITREWIRYQSYSNLSRPGSLGIGVFERLSAKEEFSAAETQLQPIWFRTLPDHSGQVLSGDRSRRIRLTAEDGAVEKLVGTKLPIDPSLQRVIHWLDTVAEDMTRYPRHVLQISLQNASLSQDGAFSATMNLSGAGDQPVVFRPPGGQPEAPDGLLTLYYWPHFPGAPKANVEAAPVFARVSAVKTPGALATYRISSRLERISAGSIAVQVRYSNMSPKLDRFDVLVGQLYSSPVAVH